MLRILIADDHGLLRAGLRSMLKGEREMEVVGEAGDGLETLALASRLLPDIVLADVSMPGLSGIEVTQELKRSLPSVRVLILTMHEDCGLLQEALRAGAAGYLVKRAAEADLIRAIQTVARGELYIHEDMRLAMPKQILPRPCANTHGASLSDSETAVLRLVARGYTNRRIAETLRSDMSTVEAVFSDISGKLGTRGRVGLIQYAKEHDIT